MVLMCLHPLLRFCEARFESRVDVGRNFEPFRRQNAGDRGNLGEGSLPRREDGENADGEGEVAAHAGSVGRRWRQGQMRGETPIPGERSMEVVGVAAALVPRGPRDLHCRGNYIAGGTYY